MEEVSVDDLGEFVSTYDTSMRDSVGPLLLTISPNVLACKLILLEEDESKETLSRAGSWLTSMKEEDDGKAGSVVFE